jgi:tetratricopeptide (TPR) repeat protein
MRRMMTSAALLLASLASVPVARAGVYNLAEPPSLARPSPPLYRQIRNPLPSKILRSQLADVRNIDDRTQEQQPRDSEWRKAYLREAAELEERKRIGGLGMLDRISLGACLIRLGRFSQAFTLLDEGVRAADRNEPGRFLLLLELARVYQEDETLLQRAVDTQSEALHCWPAMWAGWSREEWAWYRRVEKFSLDLLQARQRAAAAPRGDPPGLDALFPGVSFGGLRDDYEAGGVSFEVSNRLPVDAEQIVLQLLFWRPFDPRLTWLYGELLNARGDIPGAFQMLEEASRPLEANRELHRHLTVLRFARGIDETFTQPGVQRWLFWVAAPHGVSLHTGMGGMCNEMAWAGAYADSTRDELGALTREQPQTASPVTAPPPASAGWLPDWRPLVVGLMTGVVVSVLALLQWQEWRFRKRQKAEGRRQKAEGSLSG